MSDVVGAGFEGVLEQFHRVAQERPGSRITFAVYLQGYPAIEVSTPPAAGETLHPVFSCTKGIAGACIAMLVQRGQLDLDARVAAYWPEFAAEGKENVTVRTMLSHGAGLIGVDGGFSSVDALEHHKFAERLAAQRPYWEPGTRHGYHAVTIGVLARELLLRIDGRGTKQFYDEEIRAGRDISFTIGCPPELRARMRPQLLSAAYHEFVRAVPPPDPTSLAATAYGTEPLDLTRTPTEDLLDGDFVSVGGYADARGLARFYAALATGLEGEEPLLTERTIDQVRTQVVSGTDAVLSVLSSFGVVFMVPNSRVQLAGPGSFGHDGAAGALGFANPDLGLAFGWVSDTAVGQGADPAALELASRVEELVRGRPAGTTLPAARPGPGPGPGPETLEGRTA